MRFYNTLSAQKEDFKPIDPTHIGMYVCGPTVYDRPHLGNARPAVVFDVLYRLLQKRYPRVTYVRNITDVDDKIEAAARKRRITIDELTRETTVYYHEDLGALNVLPPTIEPKATEHIEEMICMIQDLIQKGFAYEAMNHVLFAVSRFGSYGKLSKQSLEDMRIGARIEVAPYKEDAGDFVLWKPSRDDQPGWDSPWGRGRPGWHIECSAMSAKHLGATFDIHGGGVDLVFPHHENEIAQSRCAHGADHMARLWMHNGPLTWGGEKMSKSLGNIVLLKDVLNEMSGGAVRIALLNTHYRQPLHWSEQHVSQAIAQHKKLQTILQQCEPQMDYACDEFEEALCDDLNIPEAWVYLHQYIKSNNIEAVAGASWLLGIQPETQKAQELSDKAKALLEKRHLARINKDWAASDALRDELLELGVTIQDTPDGTTWSHV